MPDLSVYKPSPFHPATTQSVEPVTAAGETSAAGGDAAAVDTSTSDTANATPVAAANTPAGISSF